MTTTSDIINANRVGCNLTRTFINAHPTSNPNNKQSKHSPFVFYHVVLLSTLDNMITHIGLTAIPNMIALKMITIGLVGNQMTKNKLIKANKNLRLILA